MVEQVHSKIFTKALSSNSGQGGTKPLKFIDLLQTANVFCFSTSSLCMISFQTIHMQQKGKLCKAQVSAQLKGVCSKEANLNSSYLHTVNNSFRSPFSTNKRRTTTQARWWSLFSTSPFRNIYTGFYKADYLQILKKFCFAYLGTNLNFHLHKK